MNITFENVDKVNGLLTITLEKTDYEEKVTAAMKDFRKKANMPGFRPGQVPMGLIKKRFGTEITAEEVNKILGTEIYKYIREQKLNVMGEPLPDEEKQPKVDFETMETFTFIFDVALAPEFDAKISNKDKIPYYNIKVEDKMVEEQIQAYAQRGGRYEKVDSYEPKDMVKGTLTQLDADGNALEGGIQVEEAVMLPDYMKDEAEKAKFSGAKVDDVLTFNPAKAYADSDVELASLLHITKEEAQEVKSDFTLQISEITRYAAAPVDQELFNQVLGKDVVKSREEFAEKIRQMMEAEFVSNSDFKFMQDLRAYLSKRIGELTFPEAMLRRIMKLNNPDKDDAYFDENFPGTLDELKWHLIKEQLSDQLEVKVEQPDVLETAKEATRAQFAQYGMMNIPDEYLTEYANNMLKNEQQAEGLVARTVENKIAQKAKAVVKLQAKDVTLAEFDELLKPAAKADTAAKE